MLVLCDVDPPGGMRAVRLRRLDRVAARLRGFSLDAALAGGASPEGGRLLAARARLLVTPSFRLRLAAHWAHLLDVARRPLASGVSRATFCRRDVLAVGPLVVELCVALRAPSPVSARGVAVASHLLADGAGPLHNGRAAADLALTLRLSIVGMEVDDGRTTGAIGLHGLDLP